MAFTSDDIAPLSSARVIDPLDDEVGSISQVYLDPDGHPSWATIRTGVLTSYEPFFPLEQAVLDGRDLRVPFTRAEILEAPRVESGEELSVRQSADLHTYYDQREWASPAEAGTEAASGEDADPAAEITMTRSEERLQVGTRRVERGRVRLRKHVVTERQTVVVPVRREQATLVREPLLDADLASTPPDHALSEEVHEIVLHGDVVVTAKEVVPVERILLGTEQVTEEREITDDVRKEHIELIDQDGMTR